MWHPMVGGKEQPFSGAGKCLASICKSHQRHLPPVSLSPSQIVNGYFVHFFAPQGLPVVPKSVVFVIDVSGSMHGRKMEQVISSDRKSVV